MLFFKTCLFIKSGKLCGNIGKQETQKNSSNIERTLNDEFKLLDGSYSYSVSDNQDCIGYTKTPGKKQETLLTSPSLHNYINVINSRLMDSKLKVDAK